MPLFLLDESSRLGGNRQLPHVAATAPTVSSSVIVGSTALSYLSTSAINAPGLASMTTPSQVLSVASTTTTFSVRSHLTPDKHNLSCLWSTRHPPWQLPVDVHSHIPSLVCQASTRHVNNTKYGRREGKNFLF